MTYRVVFAKRFQSDGQESILDPTAELDGYIPDGVVADKVFVERFDPEAKHSQEVLDEDDAFLGLAAAEVWEYEVVNERKKDFETAIENSETVMEFDVTDDSLTDKSDVTSTPLGDSSTRAQGATSPDEGVDRSGSGVRGVDDGPGGQPTGDPSAGGLGSQRLGPDVEDSYGEDLTIHSADDPVLGLTNYGDKEAEDWAADTGPTRNPK